MNFEKLYIGGQWVSSASGKWIDVENPAAGTIFARVPAGNAADVDAAVQAARRAFPHWASVSLAGRIAVMKRMLTHLKAVRSQIIDLEVRELGSPVSFAETAHCDYQYTRIQSYIDLAPQVDAVRKLPASTVYREPVGVVGCITPWNYPLGQVVQKVIPAILMGNTVVLKPSQHTPLTCYLLVQAFADAGLPDGVLNLVTGRGAEVGNVLSGHPQVDMISFTGSTSGGITVARKALESVKKISLELGGKSPCILLRSDDYLQGLRLCLNSIFLNAGQTCTALSRLLIPLEDKEKIEALLKELVHEYPIGDPSDPQTKVGPLASLQQFQKVSAYLHTGLQEGALLLTGKIPDSAGHGYYVSPAVFTNVTNDMKIAREEIFGPVLCVLTYKNVEEAIQIANDTPYGLNAAVCGPDKQEAIRVARRIQSGNIYINDGPRDTAAPFGGYKKSGLGREGGIDGMIEFTQQKALFDTGH